MVESASEAARRPRVDRHAHERMDQEVFLDRISAIAVREGADVEIRDFTRAENAGKGYWGPDISVLSLLEARGRVSPEALDRRILEQRTVIDKANAEINRLEGIRAQLYGESQGSESTASSS